MIATSRVQVAALVGTQPTFIQLVQRLYDGRYTGPYTVHTLHGQPKQIEFHAEQVTIALDTRRSS